MDNRHYVRTDGIFITKSFSDAFEQPLETDTFIEEGGRHYNLAINDDRGLPKLKYVDGEMLDTTEEDLKPLIDALPVPEVEPTVKELKAEIDVMKIKQVEYEKRYSRTKRSSDSKRIVKG